MVSIDVSFCIANSYCWTSKNGTLVKKMISGIPLLTYLICTRFNTIIDQTYDIVSGKTYMSLVVLLTGLVFLYVIGILGQVIILRIFISYLSSYFGCRKSYYDGVLSYHMGIWIKDLLFHLCSYNDVRCLFNKSAT